MRLPPFYHAASQTLYFSTDGRPNLVGFDIYSIAFDGDKEWGKPTHAGYPLNSSYNDIYFSLTKDSTIAYFSSNREGSFYLDKENKSCCNDIYKAIFNNRIPDEPTPDSTSIVDKG